MISLSDIDALATRLLARGRSLVLNDQTDLLADLVITGRLLKSLLADGTLWGGPFALDD